MTSSDASQSFKVDNLDSILFFLFFTYKEKKTAIGLYFLLTSISIAYSTNHTHIQHKLISVNNILHVIMDSFFFFFFYFNFSLQLKKSYNSW